MMQGDKENIKVNIRDCIGIVINLVVLLYFAFIAKWHYTTSLLVLKYLLLLTCIREMIHLQHFCNTESDLLQALVLLTSKLH